MPFVYKKNLGWAHNTDLEPTMIYMVTVRFQDESIPGGSVLLGRLIGMRQHSRIELFTEGSDRLYDRYAISLPTHTHSDLFDLAEDIRGNFFDDDGIPMPEPKIHQGNSGIVIVSYEENAAMRKAFEAGYRVIKDHNYSSKRDFRPRLPWKRLLEYQKYRE